MANDDPSDDRTLAIILAISKRERNVELLAELLERLGYRVPVATDMDEFDELLETRDDVALVVLDIDGFSKTVLDRCAELKDRGVPALVLTSNDTPAVRERAMSKGARAILEKPVEKAEIRATIEGVL
ncbi:response regulator [Natrononativus amylolyticus]|uniref:response regulator n=1 Tax=Natrononativus amylolyticus TaxID=2963434 RepID=UPI0020CF10B5|nr:response regulator [Natrononativus amylolyticus]